MLKQEKRIIEMEEKFDNSKKVLKEFEKSLRKFAKIQKDVKIIDEYYGSNNWFTDVEDYDSGKINKDIKAGVLSEDEIYNFLIDNRDVFGKMLEMSSKFFNNK